MTNYEIELDLKWSKYCVISETSRAPQVGGANPADATSTTEHKLYVPVVTLSMNDNIRLLEKIK